MSKNQGIRKAIIINILLRLAEAFASLEDAGELEDQKIDSMIQGIIKKIKGEIQ